RAPPRGDAPRARPARRRGIHARGDRRDVRRRPGHLQESALQGESEDARDAARDQRGRRGMQHLSPEALARLVEERPLEEESLHLELCGDCRAELESMREQTLALRALPGLAPPAGHWPRLEERLRE